MSEQTIIITESEGNYSVQNNDFSEFELIGILECIAVEMKSARRQASSGKTKNSAGVTPETTKHFEEPALTPEQKAETVQPTASPDLRTRINNAVKAIKGVGGEAEYTDLGNLTDEELQAELAELTNQYKRLKGSKASGK
jgi:hypothetical protein